jgi:hypothetical protein
MTGKEYHDQELKRLITMTENICIVIDEINNTLIQAKVLTDLDKHMAVEEANNVVRGI